MIRQILNNDLVGLLIQIPVSFALNIRLVREEALKSRLLQFGVEERLTLDLLQRHLFVHLSLIRSGFESLSRSDLIGLGLAALLLIIVCNRLMALDGCKMVAQLVVQRLVVFFIASVFAQPMMSQLPSMFAVTESVEDVSYARHI